MTQLSRKQCADLLGISLSTFQRRVKKGIYGAGVKTGPLKTDEVWYSFTDIGLPEPEPCGADSAPEPEPEQHPESGPYQPEPCVGELSPRSEPEPCVPSTERPLSDFELRQAEDLAFAEAYRTGNATDSLGNTVNGSNERFPVSGQATLLGPAVRELPPRTPRTGTAHMNPALLSDSPSDTAARNPQEGPGSTRYGSALAAGYTQDHYNADMEDWRRRRGAPSMSQQREAQERSEALIHAAFPRGSR